jgi:hypothetical protein
MPAEYDGQNAPTLHTADEAATILRVKKSWLERQAAGRKVPFTMLGGTYHFTPSHLAEIIRLFEHAPAARAPARSRGRGARGATETSRTVSGQLAPLRAKPRSGPSTMARSTDPAA